MNFSILRLTKTLLFSIFLVSVFACSEDETIENQNPQDQNPQENADQFASFAELQNILKTDLQIFTFQTSNPNNSTEFVGEEGTKVYLYQNPFLNSDDTPYNGEVKVELQEFLTLDKMIKNNIQTLSDGEFLASAGSFYLNFKDENGNELNFDTNLIMVEMPIKLEMVDGFTGMQLFTGQFDEVNGEQVFNWVPQPNGALEFSDQNAISIFNIEAVFTNCDSFPDVGGPGQTNFFILFDENQNVDETETWFILDIYPTVFQIFKDINVEVENGIKTSISLPTNISGHLVTYARDENGYLKFGSQAVNITGEQEFQMELEYGTIEELNTLLQDLTAPSLQF